MVLTILLLLCLLELQHDDPEVRHIHDVEITQGVLDGARQRDVQKAVEEFIAQRVRVRSVDRVGDLVAEVFHGDLEGPAQLLQLLQLVHIMDATHVAAILILAVRILIEN